MINEPFLGIELQSGYAMLGGSTTLTCVVNSEREPERVDWTKDQNVLSNPQTTSNYRYSDIDVFIF